MNIRTVFNQLATLGVLLSAVMLAMAALFLAGNQILEHEVDMAAVGALLFTGAVGLAGCAVLRHYTRRGATYIGRKEALLLVALSWVCGAALGALPYWIWALVHFHAGEVHPFQSFLNCYFESMSGLTTTGATVLSSIECMPQSLLLWRALTHWLGGLGIVVLFVAVLPGLGAGGKRLFQVEAPGPAPEGIRPRIRETARWLWYIYLGLTIAEVAALWAFTPMDGFAALCHTFATLATGGFSTMDASIGAYYRTPAVDAIVIVFMVLAGINFGLYYRLCRGHLRPVLQDSELRIYLTVLVCGTILVCGAVAFSRSPIVVDGRQLESSLGESIRQGLFTTVSMQTTTGFSTADFNRWPFLAKAVLLALMFIGGSSGSTAGGIKIIRVWVAFKVVLAEIEHAFRPHVVRPVRVGRVAVDAEMRLGAVAYVLGILMLFVVGAAVLMLLEQLNPESDCSFVSAATGSVATLFNIGPGLARVGAVENYNWFSPASKCVLCLLMLLGRLEVFAIVVLFRRSFWKKE